MPGLFYPSFSLPRRTPHPSSVFSEKKRKVADNQYIINHLPRAENGTRTRDLNLGKVALYQLSYFRNYRFRTGGTTASAPRLRASKPAFRDCKYKPKNLFCKIFRRILSQNYSCAARNAKKKKRRCRCDRAGMPGANAPQRTATKIRLPEMAALSIYGSPTERIPISGP